MRHLALLAALALLAGCANNRLIREQVDPVEAAGLSQNERNTLRAHLLNGDLVIFRDWTIADGQVSGMGERSDAYRGPAVSGYHQVPVDSVGLFQSDRLVPATKTIAALTIITGLSAALTVYCLTDTKACFGSCPTFYAEGGETILAEGYSASIAPALEARDVDALQGVQAVDGVVTLRMTNEALETHVTRRADLLAVPSRVGQRSVFVGKGGADGGAFMPILATAEAKSCGAEEGDCLPSVLTADRLERTSLADSLDLAARETIELTFDVPVGDRHGLLLAGRQSLLTTFLVYQGLAYAGDEVGAFLSRAGSTRRPASLPKIEELVSRIDVQVRSESGEWVTAGVVDEIGPLAIDEHVVALPSLPTGTAEIRITLPRGSWRLDALQLVSLGPAVEPVRLRPSRVTRRHEAGENTDEAEALRDLVDPANSLVTLPGTELALTYVVPDTEDIDWSFFLETEGYYLEWMRDEWMAEKDLYALAELIYEPEAALRRLAPAFKEIEGSMEEAFWGSRFRTPAPPPFAIRD